MKTFHLAACSVAYAASIVVTCAVGCSNAPVTVNEGAGQDASVDSGSAAEAGNADSGVGGLRQPCYPNGTCNAGLTCVSEVCVDLSTDAGTSEGGVEASSFEASASDAGTDAAPDVAASVCPWAAPDAGGCRNLVSDDGCSTPEAGTANPCPCSCFVNPDGTPTSLGISSCGAVGCNCIANPDPDQQGVEGLGTASCIGSK
jgi:hypothetical protein